MDASIWAHIKTNPSHRFFPLRGLARTLCCDGHLREPPALFWKIHRVLPQPQAGRQPRGRSMTMEPTNLSPCPRPATHSSFGCANHKTKRGRLMIAELTPNGCAGLRRQGRAEVAFASGTSDGHDHFAFVFGTFGDFDGSPDVCAG